MRTPDLGDVARRVADLAELRAQRDDAARVAELEVAVGENARLGVHLEQVVAELEQSLVPLLERAVAEGGDAR